MAIRAGKGKFDPGALVLVAVDSEGAMVAGGDCLDDPQAQSWLVRV
jgi:hypothetical protein